MQRTLPSGGTHELQEDMLLCGAAVLLCRRPLFVGSEPVCVQLVLTCMQEVLPCGEGWPGLPAGGLGVLETREAWPGLGTHRASVTAQQPSDSPIALLQVSAGAASQAAAFT